MRAAPLQGLKERSLQERLKKGAEKISQDIEEATNSDRQRAPTKWSEKAR